MSNENRDRLVAGILFYREAIKNSDNKEYIERCQKKIEEFSNQLRVTEFEEEVEYEKVSNDDIKRKIVTYYEGEINDWNYNN